MLTRASLTCKKKLDFEIDSELKIQKQNKQFSPSRRKMIILPSKFRDLVQEISNETMGPECKWSRSSIEPLQRAAEDYLIGILEDSNFCAQHANRVTLSVKDVQLARRIRGRFETFIGSTLN